MGMTGLFCILTWSEWNPKEQEAWPPEIHLLLLEWLFYFSMLYFPIYKMGTTTQTYQLKESRARNGSNARTDLYLAPFCFRWNLQTALGRDNSVPLSWPSTLGKRADWGAPATAGGTCDTNPGLASSISHDGSLVAVNDNTKITGGRKQIHGKVRLKRTILSKNCTLKKKMVKISTKV